MCHPSGNPTVIYLQGSRKVAQTVGEYVAVTELAQAASTFATLYATFEGS
jgi:succinyl-diaminopimelate desuccinylase